MSSDPNARALAAPSTAVTAITTMEVQRAVVASRNSQRRRIILPFHQGPEESLHRMLNALQPDSYIPPHRHLHPPKAETVLVLQGQLLCLVFDDSGTVRASYLLRPGGDIFGFDCQAGIYHTFLAMAPDTVFFEVKPGPYQAASDKDFPAWAPPEGDPSAPAYLAGLRGLGMALVGRDSGV